MPQLRTGESGKAYISRCVKQVMGEGKTQDQALGQCYGMLREKRGNKGLMPKKGK
jgi:hypothetical protein